MLLLFISLLFSFLIKSEDPFWHDIEEILFKKVNPSNFSETQPYLTSLFEKSLFLQKINNTTKNPAIIKKNQEAIETLLSVYIYTEALARYLMIENMNQILKNINLKITEQEALLTKANINNDIEKDIKELLKTLEEKRDDLMNKIEMIYSKKALINVIRKTFESFDFITKQNIPLDQMVHDIQMFIGNEIHSANKMHLKGNQRKNLFHYIQIAPLMSDQYAQRNGRFYLKALTDALQDIDAIIAKNENSPYIFRKQELIKKIIAVLSNNLLVIALIQG